MGLRVSVVAGSLCTNTDDRRFRLQPVLQLEEDYCAREDCGEEGWEEVILYISRRRKDVTSNVNVLSIYEVKAMDALA